MFAAFTDIAKAWWLVHSMQNCAYYECIGYLNKGQESVYIRVHALMVIVECSLSSL